GVASDVLHRRVARAPRSVRALPGAGIRRVAADARGVLERAGAIDRPADAAVLVPGAVDDDDELRLPWHPGPLPHLSATGLGIHPRAASGTHGALDGRSARGRDCLRVRVRPARPPP